ncbi:MAG: hypothetical protein OSB82_17830 [Alphaproteobacteria bacterium]|nr:hypothetical protein [Alphaproteobacteria bacterium]
MNNFRKVIAIPFFLLIAAGLLLSGCSDPELEKAANTLKQAEMELGRLELSLADGSMAALPNLRYLKQYAEIVRRIEPDMDKLVSTLETEGTTKGGLFTSLKNRLANAKRYFGAEAQASREAATAVSAEAVAIALAGKTDVFNDSLVDVINVLADMSKGKLPKLNFAETSDKTMPPTQHLVGNPAYGGWQRGSGGGFWVWYGQYRLFSDVLGWNRGYRYNQDYWYRSRSASYYGDVGRHYYGSGRNNQSWARAANRQSKVAANKAQPSRVKRFKSTNRLSNYAPRTRGAPRQMTQNYRAKRASTYSNSRSAPSRSGGFSGRSAGK